MEWADEEKWAVWGVSCKSSHNCVKFILTRGDYFWNFHIVNFTAIHRREEKQNFAEIIKSLNKQSTKNGREKDWSKVNSFSIKYWRTPERW